MANLYERAVYPSKWIYDVFLSYGGDYRCSSFVSCLCNSMCAKRIRVFPIDEFLTPSVEEFNAMEESRAAIIIISENYVSSTSCLNSLATILECFKKKCRSVYTIFYDVEPSKLQYQTSNREEVFAMLEKKFKNNKQQVQQWRLALSEAISRGRYYYFNPRNMAEDKFFGMFIHVISLSINAFPFDVPEDLAGLGSRVQEVISLLDVGSNEEVKTVGICGICGIGKSALARAVCNFIAHHFEDLWYFSPIYERCWFLNDLLFSVRHYEKAKGKRFSLDDFHGIIRQHWFRQRKILIILDGVEGLDHLQAVNEGCDWFSRGSRIIIMTRETQLLVSHGIKKISDVKNLSDDEAVQMLSRIAFKKDNVKSSYMDVSKRAILCSGEIPLVLEVMGNYLFGKTVDAWNCAMDEMEKDPMQMLRRFSEFRLKEERLKEFIAFMKEKEPQSIHSSMEKCTKRKRERQDTDREETQVEGKKCHA